MVTKCVRARGAKGGRCVILRSDTKKAAAALGLEEQSKGWSVPRAWSSVPHPATLSRKPEWMVLFSSLWWQLEPAATCCSSICLARSQHGGGQGFAVPPPAFPRRTRASLQQNQTKNTAGKGLGIGAFWFSAPALHRRVWQNDSGSATCMPHLAQGLSGVWEE